MLHKSMEKEKRNASQREYYRRKRDEEGHHPRPLANKETLADILRLRMEGWSYKKIGKKYGLDHTTILYHCRKHLTLEERNSSLEKCRFKHPGFIEKKKVMFHKQIPKLYKEYLEDERRRKKINRFAQ